MYKFGILITGLFGLVVSFQNCAAQNDFSTAAKAATSTTSSSIAPDLASNSPPSTSATPVVSLQCYTYVLNGPANSSGSYIANPVNPGTQVYQQLACNGRPLNYGYQASYCNGGMASCGSCAGGAATYVCGTNGFWSPVAAVAPAATPSSTQGCSLTYSGGASAFTTGQSSQQCSTECRTNANLNPTETITCKYNGNVISF